MKLIQKWCIAGLMPFFALGTLTAENLQPRIAVLDMVNPDVLGQQKYLNFTSKTINLGPGCTLNNTDRAAMNSVMQGYVRMIDAQDLTRTNAVNREMLVKDNEFNRAKMLKLYNTMVHGTARPLLLGADYLTAELAKRPETVSCINGAEVASAMIKLQKSPDFPKDFMLKLARATGATHLIYGTVADIHTKTRSFKGYGIETKTVIYELDVLIKLADLPNQRIIYSKVYTGTLQEQDLSTGGLELDGNKYQTLMKIAMAQAGEDVCARFKAQEGNFKVTPVPQDGAEKILPETDDKVPPEKEVKPAAAAPEVKPAAPKNDAVIIQQVNPVHTASGLPAVPPPPVPVPVAGEGKSIVVVNGNCPRGVTVVSVPQTGTAPAGN